MKRWMTLTLALLTLLALTGCGGGGDSGKTEVKDVDLETVYASMEEACDWWTEGYMTDIPEEMLEMYYPGIGELETQQLIAKTPMMSAVVSEVVLVKCGSEEDADRAREILQARIDYQVGDDTNPGGAWYPESIEQWKAAVVLRQGNCVALLAMAEDQNQMEDIFNRAFR